MNVIKSTYTKVNTRLGIFALIALSSTLMQPTQVLANEPEAVACLQKTQSGGSKALKNTCSRPVTCLYKGATQTGGSFTFSSGLIGLAEPIDMSRCKMGSFEELSSIPVSQW